MLKKYYILILITSVLNNNSSAAEFDTNPYGIFLQTSLIADSKVQTNKNCFCVPYWQCKEDFTGLVDDGVDIIDIRVINNDDDVEASDDTSTDNSGECTGDFDVCCRIQCGILGSSMAANNANNDEKGDKFGYRIVGTGANTATFGEFPWMLGILHNKMYKCGASLIHPKVAITAAHCVVNNEKVKVRAGEHNWANQKEPLPHQDRYTERIIIHPNYHAPSLSNDIAILILDKEFKIGENVGIVCLPSGAPKSRTLKKLECLASGWGKNSFSNGVYQSTLKKVQLPLIPRNVCLESLRRARLGPLFNLHPSFICAGGKHNRDTCKGDGGSPLVCPTSIDADHYEQIGIVSWGLTCGLKNTPGVYVNVALFLDWIDQQVDNYNLDTMVYKF